MKEKHESRKMEIIAFIASLLIQLTASAYYLGGLAAEQKAIGQRLDRIEKVLYEREAKRR